MKKSSILLFCICLLMFSCSEKSEIEKLKTDSSLSSLIKQNQNKNSILLLIKNDECGACKMFYDYIDANFDSNIGPKLPADMKVFQISINNFNNKNVWLFHVLERYSFPTVLFIDKSGEIKNIHIGADLYSFSSFLNNLNNQSQSNKLDLKTKSIIAQGYISLIEDDSIPQAISKKIATINQKQPFFLSALLEGYSYKYKKVHPDRVKYIKEMLQKKLQSSNQFYIIHKKLIEKL